MKGGRNAMVSDEHERTRRSEYPAWVDDLDSPEWTAIFADPRWQALVRKLDRLRVEREAAEAPEHDNALVRITN
jgi:hypothetical protein